MLLLCRKEHEELALQVEKARAMQEGFAEDLATMAGHAADVRAAREAAETALSNARRAYDMTRTDWRRKLQDRRKKVAPSSNAGIACLSHVVIPDILDHQFESSHAGSHTAGDEGLSSDCCLKLFAPSAGYC